MNDTKSRRRHSVRSSSSADRRSFRGRRLSQSSARSQAVVDDSDAASRKTSHADDSDASGTDESLGETEEDVWFRDDNVASGDINVSELDQLLNLSDEEGRREFEAAAEVASSAQPLPRIVVASAEQPQTRPSSPSVNTEYFECPPAPPSATKPSRPGQNPAARSTRPPGSLLLSRAPQFVKYTPAVADEKNGFSELKLNEDEFESSDYSLEKNGGRNGSTNPSVQVGAGTGPNQGTGPGSQSSSGHGLGADTGPSSEVNSTFGAPFNSNAPPHVSADSQRFSFYAANMETTIHAPDLASLVREHDSFSNLFDPQNGTWFLDCYRPTQLEMRALSRAFGIHPLTTEDIQTEEAREKFEKFANYYLVVYHTFESDVDSPKYMDPVNFYILVFNEGVISFHFEPVSHCRTVRRRMRQLRDHLAFTSDWVAYALVDDITDGFAPKITAVEKEADFVENAVYLDRNSVGDMHELLQRLGEGRRMTMHLLRMLAGKADVVRGFAKRCGEVHSAAGSEMALYLGDIQDHVVTMYQNLSAYEKIFSRTHFNYMGLLQMEFVDSSNQMTSVLGKVTVLGTVLVPMNLVTGLFGMNVKIPGQDGPNLHWFFGILGVMLGVMAILLVSGAYYVKRSTRG